MTRRMSTDTEMSYSRIVERYSHFFDRPELRLRFLNNTLGRQAVATASLDHALRRFGFIKRTILYRQLLDVWFYKLIFQELKQLLPSDAKEPYQLLRENKAPFSARALFGCYRVRHMFYLAGVILTVAAPFALYSVGVHSSHQINAYLAQRYRSYIRTESNAGERNAIPAPATINYLPDYRPEKVWLVEQKENSERYSNGGRILTDYQISNHPRGFYVLPRGKAAADNVVYREPVGILYHTSESDLLPFTHDNNQSIEAHTRGLLEYVRQNRSYHYVIDRFGQIYRIVRDEDAANHAGHSVWADHQGIYVGLNESFLGVCFETRSDAGPNNEQLTEAQIISGRLLTQILRSRYNIDDANCVTHGLVSVNPTNMLICYHHDWVRNFPFEAFGLSDKYQVAPASISEFGFTYDDETVHQVGGEIWPGAKLAQEEFNRRAEQAKVKPEEMRRLMRERYRQQVDLARKLRSSSPSEAEVNHQNGEPPRGALAPREDGNQEQGGTSEVSTRASVLTCALVVAPHQAPTAPPFKLN